MPEPSTSLSRNAAFGGRLRPSPVCHPPRVHHPPQPGLCRPGFFCCARGEKPVRQSFFSLGPRARPQSGIPKGEALRRRAWEAEPPNVLPCKFHAACGTPPGLFLLRPWRKARKVFIFSPWGRERGPKAGFLRAKPLGGGLGRQSLPTFSPPNKIVSPVFAGRAGSFGLGQNISHSPRRKRSPLGELFRLFVKLVERSTGFVRYVGVGHRRSNRIYKV